MNSCTVAPFLPGFDAVESGSDIPAPLRKPPGAAPVDEFHPAERHWTAPKPHVRETTVCASLCLIVAHPPIALPPILPSPLPLPPDAAAAMDDSSSFALLNVHNSFPLHVVCLLLLPLLAFLAPLLLVCFPPSPLPPFFIAFPSLSWPFLYPLLRFPSLCPRYAIVPCPSSILSLFFFPWRDMKDFLHLRFCSCFLLPKVSIGLP